MLQIFLSIGAITLLAIATLSMNRGFEVNDTVMRSSKYAVIATSLAISSPTRDSDASSDLSSRISSA